MKKKLTVNTLALGNLKTRKKQYAVMIIGIILAMVFSSGIMFFLFSFTETTYEKQLNEYGNQNAILYLEGADKEYYDSLIDDGTFESYALAHTIGYGYTDEEKQPQGASIAWLEDGAKELSNQSFIEGSYPAKENEIAIERNTLDKLGYKDAKIGDEINLYVKVQNDNDFYKTVEKTYKLSGIVSDKKLYLNKDYAYGINDFIPACFVMQGTETETGGKEKLIAYANVDLNIREDYEDDYDKLWKHIVDFADQNKEYRTNFEHASKKLFGISYIEICGVVLTLVLVFASCVAIVNSFNSNLKERKKQIGMLRAVGATKRQIIKIFGREAFIIALITSPVAMIISYIAVSIVLKLFNSDVVVTKSIIVLPVSLIVGIITVMLASLVPLISASKITPMQAIRDIEQNRKMKTKKIKSKKEFKVSSLVAQRNLNFSKGSRISVSVMLIAIIVLSSFGFSFMQYAKDDFFEYNFDYKLNYGFYTGIYNLKSENVGPDDYDKANIASIDYLSKVYSYKQIGTYININDYTDYFRICADNHMIFNNKDNLTYDNYFDETRGEFSQEYFNYKKAYNENSEMFVTNIISTDNNALRELSEKDIDGEINLDKLASGEEIILVAPKKTALTVNITQDRKGNTAYDEMTIWDNEKSEYKTVAEDVCPYKAGDKITLNVVTYENEDEAVLTPEKYDKKTKEVTIGAIISPNDLENNSSYLMTDTLFILTSNQGMNNFYENKKYDEFTILCDEEITPEIDERIMNALQEYVDLYSLDLISNFDIVQRQQNEHAAFFASMIAVIIIGFSICASIINNTLTARIRESKREIGTLRAFGADLGELAKSYTLQMFSMFTWGTGLGFLAFLIGYGIIYLAHKVNESMMNLVFYPYITILFVIILFAVCAVNLRLKIKKEMKNSIIDNIREL